MPRKTKDLSGRVFGRLLVIEFETIRNKNAYFLCKCDCGTIKSIRGQCLLNGTTVSCGCYQKEVIGKAAKARRGILSPMHNRTGPLHHNYGKRGDQCSNWRGGKSSENDMIRKRSDYKVWRENVFNFANYTCIKCKNRGGLLRAHHIFPFHKFPDLRTTISNGCCLCDSCHKNFHSKYGRLNNNYQQLIEFLHSPLLSPI